MSLNKIPATVITGFLGAGKTTLIRNLITSANGRRIALIVNEFGDVGIDGEILKACGNESCREDDIIELANGCICCTVADDFIPAMTKLIDRPDPPDHIVIETSGLALPQPLVRAFNWPEIKRRVTVDGVVTVVDGRALADGRFAADEAALAAQRRADPGLDHDNPIEELFEDQLNCADMIIVSKADLLEDGEAHRVLSELKPKVRPGAAIVPVEGGRVDASALIGLNAAAEDDLQTRLSHHELEGEEQHDHDDFDSFVVEIAEAKDRAELERRISSAIASYGILRLKGFVSLEDSRSRLLVQAVGPRLSTYFDRPWKTAEERRSDLVVIGLRGLDRAAIAAALSG
ncbi:MAG: cobalamin biosynthesis protein CobW [Hyphomicrobiales bacterium]